MFTTALVHHLTKAPRCRPSVAAAEGRIRRAQLAHQPDDEVPRFPYEEHVAALDARPALAAIDQRGSASCGSTSTTSAGAGWRPGPATLALDIVDYPGEWLLDLALIDATYATGRAQTIEGEPPPRPGHACAAHWHESLQSSRPAGPADEVAAGAASDAFKAYLAALRAGPEAVATTPPGRFLMPGDLAGSPALTFAPLDRAGRRAAIAPNSLAALMERRFEAYKTHVVRPFFRDHFQRIDRQIVLVDVLAAIDAGPVALAELEEALDRVLMAFRPAATPCCRACSRRAPTGCCSPPRRPTTSTTPSHDRLDALLRILVNRAARRTEAAGARVGTVALASVRATRETSVREGGEVLKAVAGTPEAGEIVGDEVFDGETEAAVFPGRAAGASRSGASRARSRRARSVSRASGRRRLARRCGRSHRAAAAYPPRPGARIPARRPPRMTRKPRAFRLDDPNVATVPERRAPLRHRRDPDEPIDAIEAADGIPVPMAAATRAMGRHPPVGARRPCPARRLGWR